MTAESRPPPSVWLAALVIAAAAGLWARLAGFGWRPLAVDEYFFLASARTILDSGLPRFLDGGYYTVALIPQYLTALSVWLLGESELAVRVPALLAGLALPALAYRYVRGHASAELAAAVAAALLLSSWQIEFSRFGRMYTAFSCATLLLLTRFDRSLAGEQWGRRHWTHLWAIVAVLCHREGALLAPLLFAPLLDDGRFSSTREKVRYGFITALVVGAIVAFAAVDWRHLGVANAYPAGYERPWSGPLRPLAPPLWGASPAAALAVVAVCTSAAFAGARVFRRDVGAALTAAACGAALLHQLMLAALPAFLLIARSPRDRRLLQRIGAIAACAALWPSLAALGIVSLRPEGGGFTPGAIHALFLSWPNFYESIWRPWSADLPWIGGAVALAVLFGGLREQRPWIAMLATPAGIAAYAIACFGFVGYFYESTRYHFFLYPVLLATVAVAFGHILGHKRGAIGFFGLFLAAGDFDPRHIARAGGEEVGFRLGPFQNREGLWYPRRDERETGAALTGIAAQGTPVIANHCHPLALYFQENLACYLRRDEPPFMEQSRKGGTVELWTGLPLLSSADEIRAWTAAEVEVLLSHNLARDADVFDPKALWGGRLLDAERVFTSRDERFAIIRVQLQPRAAAPKQ